MGVIYRAMDSGLGREVAVKVPREWVGPNSAATRRFVDEARITGQLQHPGIPPVYDYGHLPDGRPWFAMKLIKGRTLEEIFREGEAPAEPRLKDEDGSAGASPSRNPGSPSLLAVFECICQTVAYAHARGIIHRDLEPSNIMVGSFGEIQVLDWGLAIVNQQTATEFTVTVGDTQPGTAVGTPAYMPPEQARGEAVDYRADVFGLGAILCHILTGRPPFTGDTSAEIVRKAAVGDVSDALARLDRCGANAELVALAKRCLSPKPNDRPADAGAVASIIAGYRNRGGS